MLDHVDLTHEVGDGDVGRGQFLLVAMLSADPGNWRRVTHHGDLVPPFPGQRRKRVVIDLRPFDDGHRVVE